MPAPLPVVGVMPPGIRFLPDPGASSEPNYDLNAHVDFWFGVAPDESRPTDGVGNAVARLRGGATVGQAQTEVAALSAGLAQADSALQGITAAVVPVQDVLNRDGRRLLVPLFGSVALVFFIACANVAGLLLTRGLQRHSEYAMRSALGAGRWRLFRQALTESLVLALAGAALGRGTRDEHHHGAQGDCRAGRAARRRRARRMAGLRLRSCSRRWLRPASPACSPRRARRYRIDSRASRALARPPAAASGGCSAPSRRCRSSSPSRSCRARRSSSARPATSIACSPATTPRTSWR